ncbi:hypothetical protein DAERI_080156 [Deinococcus aerius]|uniref:Uncharacterized protein n=1 Tax=Deinococcus aerius TaxID=200253 RepID=A0A2I9DZE0_9DEIO|nr:hypothetical protein [Deinococcus aerius]GBF06365.1 hypothetical protein DAERI_080156 [Deinococcus aerius]
MTREFNSVVAHFGDAAIPGRIEALEGGRGFMRVSLTQPLPEAGEGTEGVLEMHDGARFRVTVTERLPGGNELRMKLVGRG